MKMYNVVSKEEIRTARGNFIPKEQFIGPYFVIGQDADKFYVVLGDASYFSSDSIEGCKEKLVPLIEGFIKDKYKLVVY